MKNYNIFFAIFFALFSCQSSIKEAPEYFVNEQHIIKDSLEIKPLGNATLRPGYKEYVSDKYHLSFSYPKEWNVYESDTSATEPVINVYRWEDANLVGFPISIHSRPDISHISFYPLGLATELPPGRVLKFKEQIEDLPVAFPLDNEDSKLLQLENLQVFRYYLKPANPPKGWDSNGFIFVQLAVDGIFSTCHEKDSGLEKDINACDPLAGDKVKMFGDVNSAVKRAAFNILSSSYFFEDKETRKGHETQLIIDLPSQFWNLSSPLAIAGQADKSWYSKNRFEVEITDTEYNVLASGNAVAQPVDDGSEFVPFEITLNYYNPTDLRGYLVFKNSNFEKDIGRARAIIVPVEFAPQF